MNKKFTALFLFIITFSLYLFYMHAGLFHMDMVALAAYAEYNPDIPDPTMSWEYQKYDNNILPWRTGNYILTKIIYNVTQIFTTSNAEFAVFLTQFIAGALACVFLFLFLENEYKDGNAAAICALLFSLSAPLFTATLAKDQATEMCFAMLAMYLLSRAIQKPNVLTFAAASTSLGLLLWMREITIFFPVIFFGFFIIKAIKQRDLINKKNIAALIIPYFLLTAGALYVYAWNIIVLATQDLSGSLLEYTTTILSEIWMWYGPLFLMFVLLGLIYGVQKREKTMLFFTMMALLFLLSFTKNATFDIRQLGIYVLFPLITIICYGVTQIRKKQNWKAWTVTAITIILGMHLFSLGMPINEARSEQVYQKEFAIAASNTIPENSMIFAYRDFCLFFMYYGDRFCEPLPTDFVATANQYIDEGIPIYVLYHAGFGFYDDETKQQIENTFSLNAAYIGTFENYHHADLVTREYEETLIEVTK